MMQHNLRKLIKNGHMPAVILTALSTVSVPAVAMLPTPEPALDNPYLLKTTLLARQNSGDNMQQLIQQSAASGYGAAPTQMAANPASPVSGNQIVSKVTATLVGVDANGQEQLIPVDANTQLQPGNVVEYHGYFTNTNDNRIRNMTVTMSIPKQVELLEVITPEFPFASVDGNVFSRMPLQGVVDGQKQVIPLQYYRAVRWNIEGLGLNETTVVKYRARVK